MSASDGIGHDGLIEKVAVRLDEYIIDLELNYLVLEGSRGWVDVCAGVRYTNLYNKLSISPNDEAIDRASGALVDDIGDEVRERLAELDLRGRLRTALEGHVRGLTDRIEGVDGKRPALPIAPLGAGVPSASANWCASPLIAGWMNSPPLSAPRPLRPPSNSRGSAQPHQSAQEADRQRGFRQAEE